MADNQITILQVDQFGSRGDANGQFDYPAGIEIVGSELFVVDRQNHRIQVFDLSGNYLRQFGSQGSGNDQFYFPEDISSDGTYLYITDSGNHRVKIYNLNGDFGSEFGDNTIFDYPYGIYYKDNYLYIADRQGHKLQKWSKTGSFVSEYSGNLSYPEGVTVQAGQVVVVDTGNKEVKFFDTSLSLIDSFKGIDYPTYVFNFDQFLGIVEKQADTLHFYDENNQKITTYSENLNYPYDAYYHNDQLFISDSGNHRIIICNVDITIEVPAYLDQIINLSRQLYPTGRAWIMAPGSVFKKLHAGLALSESRVFEAAKNIYNSLLPDNSKFTDTDAERWIQALGIYKPGGTLEEKKAAILRKMKFPGGKLYRQSDEFLQEQLQNAGFDVYVERVYGSNVSLYGDVIYGDALYNDKTQDFDKTIIANYISESQDTINYSDFSVNQRFIFLVGGENPEAGNRASISADKKEEFRELILRIKPAHTVGYLLIDYV